MRRGERPVIRSDGTYVRDYLYVEDVVDAYLLLGELLEPEGLAGQAFNFGDESPVSVTAMYEAVCEAVGRSYVEPEVLDNAVGEIREQYLSAVRAREVLGWKAQIGLEEGLARTVAWYESLFAGGSADGG